MKTRRLRRTRFVSGLLMATAIGAGLAGPMTAAHAVASPGPFTCQPGFYQVNDGQLKLLNPDGTYTDIGAKRDAYNAIGFNPVDGYLYGLSNAAASVGHLVKIANDGSLTDLGPVTNLPVEKIYTGDFDANGNLVVRYGNTYYSINVSAATKAATAISPISGTPDGADAALIDGVMYSVQATTLYRFNISTRALETKDITGLGTQTTDGEKTFGAAWTDKDKNLYVANNGTGKIMKIAGYTGNTPSATLEVTGEKPTVGADGVNNDGGSCRNAPAPFEDPVAVNDTYPAIAGTELNTAVANGILKNDSGRGLVLNGVTVQPQHGTVTVNADGSFRYTPTAGYSGPDSFKYKAKDEWNRVTNEATVTLAVKPVAKDDSYTLDLNLGENTAPTGLLDNDKGTSIAIISNTNPSHGEVTVQPNGGFNYVPDDGFEGIDTFTYTIKDSAGQTATAKVTIDVTGTPDVGGSRDSRGGSLADTGGRPQTLVLLGFTLLAMGGALVALTRRRLA